MAAVIGIIILVLFVLSLVVAPVLILVMLAGGAVYVLVYAVLVLGSS